MITPRFKNLEQFATYIAEGVLKNTLFKENKIIKEWDYKLPFAVIEAIPEAKLKCMVLNDIKAFEGMIVEKLFQKLEYFFLEGFIKESGDQEYLELRSQEDIDNEINSIINEK